MSWEVSALRATAHPLRLRMLSLLTGAQLSAAEVARELGITQANASYHLRLLAAAGLLEVAAERRVRGGLAKVYRHPWADDSPWTSAPEAEPDASSAGFVRAIAEELVRRYAYAAPRRPQSATDAEVWVRPEVWEEVLSAVIQASSRLHAHAEPPRARGTVHVNMSAALFELTDEPAEPRTRPASTGASRIQSPSRRRNGTR
ncbi:MAG TPA: helix-turn-helix domain-containing protein [Nocardioidaceae bacterium]|nr:helix-turn-helix domain-containing protein [Nocardioidaceae bacterium]